MQLSLLILMVLKTLLKRVHTLKIIIHVPLILKSRPGLLRQMIGDQL